jgi:hypothetical protein
MSTLGGDPIVVYLQFTKTTHFMTSLRTAIRHYSHTKKTREFSMGGGLLQTICGFMDPSYP